jgi:hypothetical protein
MCAAMKTNADYSGVGGDCVAEKVKKPREVATADLIQQYEGKLALLQTWESLRAETQLQENDYIIALKSRLRHVRNYLLHRKDPIANI